MLVLLFLRFPTDLIWSVCFFPLVFPFPLITLQARDIDCCLKHFDLQGKYYLLLAKLSQLQVDAWSLKAITGNKNASHSVWTSLHIIHIRTVWPASRAYCTNACSLLQSKLWVSLVVFALETDSGSSHLFEAKSPLWMSSLEVAERELLSEGF